MKYTVTPLLCRSSSGTPPKIEKIVDVYGKYRAQGKLDQLFKFEGDDTIYYITSRYHRMFNRDVLDEPQSFRSAYAQIVGMKVKDIEALRREKLANKDNYAREDAKTDIERIARVYNIRVSFNGD